MALMTFASWLNVVGSWAHSWPSFNDIFIKAPNVARRPENPLIIIIIVMLIFVLPLLHGGASAFSAFVWGKSFGKSSFAL